LKRTSGLKETFGGLKTPGEKLLKNSFRLQLVKGFVHGLRCGVTIELPGPLDSILEGGRVGLCDIFSVERIRKK